MNQYQIADIILEFIDRQEHHNQMFDNEEIQKTLFPNEDPQNIERILEWMDTYSHIPRIVKYEDYYITRTVHTKEFLKNGGFVADYNKLVEQSNKERDKEELEIRKTKTDLELAEKTLKDYKTTKLLSRIAFLVSLGLAILELVKWLRQ